MKNWILVLLALACGQAYAGLEFRAHYGQMTGKPDSFNKDMETNITNAPDLGAQNPMGADALYVVPILGVAAGIRFETMSEKSGGDGTISGFPVHSDAEFKASRLSLLGGYRLLNNPLLFLGVLGHYGISQKAEVTQKLTGTVTSDTSYTGTVDSSFGVGVEGGVTIGMLLVGAEVGWTSFKAKNFKASDGSYLEDINDKRTEIDLTGTYWKILLGATF